MNNSSYALMKMLKYKHQHTCNKCILQISVNKFEKCYTNELYIFLVQSAKFKVSPLRMGLHDLETFH